MKILSYVDLYDPFNLLDDTGSEFTLPAQELGKELSLSLRFYDRVGGQKIEKDVDIRSLNATVGKIALPDSGTWKVLVGVPPIGGTNTTAALPFNLTAERLAAAINAVAAAQVYGACSGTDAGDCRWFLTFAGNSGPVPLLGVGIQLAPRSFVRIRAALKDGIWRHEVRLLRAPIAASAVAGRIVPIGPTIERIQSGATVGSIVNNEVQVLTVPAAFRGTYTLRRGFQKTAALDRSDFAEDIQAALEAKFGEGNFSVSNPTTAKVRIEFIGDFAGIAQDELIPEVETAPPGDWTTRLNLANSDAAEAIGTAEQDEFLLEIDAMIAEPGDADDFPGRPALLLSIPITVRRELRYSELQAIAPLDFGFPAGASSYLPFNPSMVGVGQTPYSISLGDGVLTQFVVVHNRNTQILTGYVAIDKATKRLLVPGVDYTAYATTPNTITLNFTAAPALVGNETGVFFAIATPQSLQVALEGLLIEIANVNGLQSLFNDFGTRLTAVEAKLPQLGAGASAASGTALSVQLPNRLSIFPRSTDRKTLALLKNLKITGEGDDAKMPEIDVDDLPRAGYLVPAVHEVPIAVIAELPDPKTVVGGVRIWNGESTILTSAGGVPKSELRHGEKLISDGRMWCASVQKVGTRSHYAQPFEQEFLPDFPINDAQFRIGGIFTMECYVGFQLFRNEPVARPEVEVQYTAVIELGTINRAAFTGPDAGPNLSSITWNTAAPAVSQRVTLSELAMFHRFGIRIKRLADGFTAEGLKYGQWIVGAGVPTSADFVIRGRLVEFDINDALGVDPNPSGLILTAVHGFKANIA